MDEPRGLVEVRFVGGPLHGAQVFMASPAFKMSFEASPGEEVEYCRRMVESRLDDEKREVAIATYAPTGTSDPDFHRLVLDAAKVRR